MCVLLQKRVPPSQLRLKRFLPVFLGAGMMAFLATTLAFLATAFWVSLREKLLIDQSGTIAGGLWIDAEHGVRAGPVFGGLTLYLATVAVLARRSVPVLVTAAPPSWSWCTSCGYLLGGETCPECGSKSPRALPATVLGWWQLRIARRIGRHWLAGATVAAVSLGLFWPLIAGTAKQWVR